jgi:hypothetical protein
MPVELVRNLSENARRGIAILGHVPPISTLSFVVQSKEKAKVGDQVLSENLFERKLGKRDD